MTEKFKSKSMLANIEFTKTRTGPFIGKMIIAAEVYQYRYPYYLPESILFLSTYNDYYRNHKKARYGCWESVLRKEI